MKKIALIIICFCLISCFKKEVKNPYQSKNYNSIQEAELDAKNGNPYAQERMKNYFKRKNIRTTRDCTNAKVKEVSGEKIYEGCKYFDYRLPPKVDDLKQAIYWAQKYSCNPYGRPDSWLGYIYEGDPNSYCTRKCTGIYHLPELIGLLPTNLPMAYAHYYFAFKKPFATNTAIERLERKMTEEEIVKAKEIINKFKSKECPYDNRI